MASNEFREELEIAISGGGFRAAAFGLGVLLYLVDSGLNHRVVTIASVSGGSITNGFVASRCDFKGTDTAKFRPVAGQLARLVSGNGRFRGFWLFSRPYLALLAVSGLMVLAWFTNMFVALGAQVLWDQELRTVSLREMTLFAIVVVIWGVAALSRGALVLRWISRTFLGGEPVTLGTLRDRETDHVFCATDLTSSCPFFFSTKSGGRVFSESYGRGEGRDIPLKIAVAASAAFPPLIPPMRLQLRGRRFAAGNTAPDFIYLSDGGVWNNLGTDWSRLRSSSLTAEVEWSKQELSSADATPAVLQAVAEHPMGSVLVIANASKPESQRALWMIKVPVFSFVTTLMRVLDVAVNSTIKGRSGDIERITRVRMLNDPDRWELGEDAPRPQYTVWGEGRGTDPPLAVAVEMMRKPGETAGAYRLIGGLEQWRLKPDDYERETQAALQKLAPLLEGEDKIIPTTLDNIGPRDTIRMIVLGYLNTRETFTVAFANHTPPPIPSSDSFEALVAPGSAASVFRRLRACCAGGLGLKRLL